MTEAMTAYACTIWTIPDGALVVREPLRAVFLDGTA
jgi:hypothetical protein